MSKEESPVSNKYVRKPNWIRVKAPTSQEFQITRKIMRENNLNTVCEEAACPNIGECWSLGHATVMILGDVCTRACSFCNVATGKPRVVDPFEPENVANLVSKLKLNHVVVTSVDRDDLSDGGASQFVKVIGSIRAKSSTTSIEVLTPDFLRKNNALESVINANPDVFNHNIETVPRLYSSIRPGARYFHSMRILQKAKEINRNIFTKSGLMVGLGEKKDEVLQVMDDMRSAGVDFLTIGQYLQPTLRHTKVDRYVTLEEFEYYEKIAISKGFLLASCKPLTRSSYHAAEDFYNLKASRESLNPSINN